MTDQITSPSIYVACLAAYNNGILHGKWIEADQDADGIHAEISKVLKSSPIPDAEEWAIHDYEGFEGVQISEYEGVERVAELAAFLAEYEQLGGAVLSHYGDDLEDARKAMTDHYIGEYSSVADYAQEFTEETTEIPENLSSYIDYERMAYDMEINDLVAIEIAHDEVHLFWNH